jgi:hypothetical protein
MNGFISSGAWWTRPHVCGVILPTPPGVQKGPEWSGRIHHGVLLKTPWCPSQPLATDQETKTDDRPELDMLTAARASGWSFGLAPDQMKNTPAARAAVAAMYCTRPKLDHCTAPGLEITRRGLEPLVVALARWRD